MCIIYEDGNGKSKAGFLYIYTYIIYIYINICWFLFAYMNERYGPSEHMYAAVTVRVPLQSPTYTQLELTEAAAISAAIIPNDCCVV